MYLSNLSVEIIENKQELTLKELIELYGEDFIPPYFVKNAGGRIYPFSFFWKELLIKLDSQVQNFVKEQKKRSENVKNDCSRSWKKHDKRMDKYIASQIFR